MAARDWGRVEQWIELNASYNLRKAHAERKAKGMEDHRKALFELGYVEKRVFVLSNTLTGDRANALWALHHIFTNDVLEISKICSIGTNTVTVIGLRNEMPQWEKAIRQIDAPQK